MGLGVGGQEVVGQEVTGLGVGGQAVVGQEVTGLEVGGQDVVKWQGVVISLGLAVSE